MGKFDTWAADTAQGPAVTVHVDRTHVDNARVDRAPVDKAHVDRADVDKATADLVLPPGHTAQRPHAGMVDDLVALVHACDIATIGTPDFSADDVREWFEAAFTRPEADGWVVFDETVFDETGTLVAWAYLESRYDDRREDATVYVHPDADPRLFRPLVAALIRRSGQRAAEQGREDSLVQFWWTDGEDDLQQAAQDAGATPVRSFKRMTRPLTGDELPPEPPPGVTLQGIDHTDEDAMRAFHRVVLEAFSEQPGAQAGAYEAWRANIAAATTMPYDEWLVAEADGRPVGVLQTSDFSADSTGWVRNLGVLRPYRRRGIGRCLLETAFATFARKGYRTAGLVVDLGDDTASMRVYESAGMTLMYESQAWQLVVPAAAEAPTRH
jgi:GNAT superfamily N-acetyltransferase